MKKLSPLSDERREKGSSVGQVIGAVRQAFIGIGPDTATYLVANPMGAFSNISDKKKRPAKTATSQPLQTAPATFRGREKEITKQQFHFVPCDSFFTVEKFQIRSLHAHHCVNAVTGSVSRYTIYPQSS